MFHFAHIQEVFTKRKKPLSLLFVKLWRNVKEYFLLLWWKFCCDFNSKRGRKSEDGIKSDRRSNFYVFASAMTWKCQTNLYDAFFWSIIKAHAQLKQEKICVLMCVSPKISLHFFARVSSWKRLRDFHFLCVTNFSLYTFRFFCFDYVSRGPSVMEKRKRCFFKRYMYSGERYTLRGGACIQVDLIFCSSWFDCKKGFHRNFARTLLMASLGRTCWVTLFLKSKKIIVRVKVIGLSKWWRRRRRKFKNRNTRTVYCVHRFNALIKMTNVWYLAWKGSHLKRI